MGNTEIREPKQERSIEKKKRIIEAGFKLIWEKGYHNTNSVEIAKAAGVSTGIIYNYFTDKRDIFIEGIKGYLNNLTVPLFQKLSTMKEPMDLKNLLYEYIEMVIQSHDISKDAHEEMMAMSHSDREVAMLVYQFEIDTTNSIIELMKNNNIVTENLREKVHIAIGLIENLCHERVYHQHESMDYDVMTEEVIKIVVGMLAS